MPMAAGTADQPSTAPPYADTLAPNRRPALNATSDMPSVATIDLNGPQAGEESGTVDNNAKPDKTDGTSGDADTSAAPDGEADGAPTKVPGEEKDQTSPQQRAAFARERNRRQAAEREAAEFRAQVTQLAEAVAKLTGAKEDPKDKPQPTRADFDSPEAHEKALVEWASARAKESALAEAKADQQRQQQASHVETVVNTFNERKTAFEADHPDFEDVVYQDDVKISPAMSQAILEAEDGPAIAYYLGQNIEAAERISKLSPASAVAELGRISAKLAEPPPRPRAAPIRPLAARNNVERSPDEMSMEEYALVSPNRRKTN